MLLHFVLMKHNIIIYTSCYVHLGIYKIIYLFNLTIYLFISAFKDYRYICQPIYLFPFINLSIKPSFLYRLTNKSMVLFTFSICLSMSFSFSNSTNQLFYLSTFICLSSKLSNNVPFFFKLTNNSKKYSAGQV